MSVSEICTTTRGSTIEPGVTPLLHHLSLRVAVPQIVDHLDANQKNPCRKDEQDPVQIAAKNKKGCSRDASPKGISNHNPIINAIKYNLISAIQYTSCFLNRIGGFVKTRYYFFRLFFSVLYQFMYKVGAS